MATAALPRLNHTPVLDALRKECVEARKVCDELKGHNPWLIDLYADAVMLAMWKREEASRERCS